MESKKPEAKAATKKAQKTWAEKFEERCKAEPWYPSCRFYCD